MAYVQVYDTTLRDGTQGEGVQLSLGDKLAVAELLDEMGVQYIEGGWPGTNPKDQRFFVESKKLTLSTSRLVAFGATRTPRLSCGHDPEIQELVKAETPVITVFGKTWKLHVDKALEITPEQNLELIEETLIYLKSYADEVIFDAEHFFDGYKDDDAYAMKVLEAAERGGADWLVLCDTNGGSLPHIVADVTRRVVEGYRTPIGVHTHNDSELAVANAIAAVHSGARMVQGTINGYGERCGNANLVSIIPTLQLKMGHSCLPGTLSRLTHLSRAVDETLNHASWTSQPYVGKSAFAHKGGVHVTAMAKDSRTYEHIDPIAVGNHTRVLLSDAGGRYNVLAKAADHGITLDPDDPRTRRILQRVKQLEDEGFEFEAAEASFFLLLREAMGERARYFNLEDLRVTVRIRGGDDFGPPQMQASSQSTKDRGPERDGVHAPATAHIALEVAGVSEEATAKGHGPVDAMDAALRKALDAFYPSLLDVSLVDYKVRILTDGAGAASVVRVLIRSGDGETQWNTVGVSDDIIDASWQALVDSFEYKLVKAGVPPASYQAAT